MLLSFLMQTQNQNLVLMKSCCSLITSATLDALQRVQSCPCTHKAGFPWSLSPSTTISAEIVLLGQGQLKSKCLWRNVFQPYSKKGWFQKCLISYVIERSCEMRYGFRGIKLIFTEGHMSMKVAFKGASCD